MINKGFKKDGIERRKEIDGIGIMKNVEKDDDSERMIERNRMRKNVKSG